MHLKPMHTKDQTLLMLQTEAMGNCLLQRTNLFNIFSSSFPSFLQSMELLILSKLKWDLTAVTSYDYLDYMIHNVQNSSAVTLDVQVKRNSEKLVTLCAKEEAFLTTPPSLVAASALITSIEQDNSINQLHVNLNHILDSVLEASNSTMVSLSPKS